MNINRKEPQTNVPQNVGSKEDQISKNIRSRHTQNTAMLILLLCTQCVLRTMLIVVRQQSIGSWLSTISIAEFLMYFPFHTIQLTHKIPTGLYMGTLAGRALFGWSLSVSVYVGYYRGYLHWRDKWCSEVNGSKRFRVSRDSMLPVYHCWIAVLTHLGGAGYAKSVRRWQNCLLDTKRWCQSCKVQRSKILLVKRIDLSIYLKTTQRKSELRCRLQRQARLSIHQFHMDSYPLAYPQTFSDPLWRGEWLISLV